MSAAAITTNLRQWREQRQARQEHEPLENQEEHPDDDHPLQLSEGNSRTRTPNNEVVVETVTEDEGDEDDDVENQRGQVDEEASPETREAVVVLPSSRRTVSLADLEEERELARRRTSACVLLAVFILFRLWIQALFTGDFGLLLLCLVGTSWTARFIRHTREREEELSRLIQEYAQNSENGEVNRSDVRMLSFQAQLALAIMESQRQMMEGGYGNPDGHGGTPGVSDQAKERWNRFKWKAEDDAKTKGGYGSVAQKEKEGKEEEEPHCSICLGEYEEGEELACLPCKHIYHEDCVASWCTNHIRCPLCNFDLESVSEEESPEQL
jgi:hypothetical protein